MNTKPSAKTVKPMELIEHVNAEESDEAKAILEVFQEIRPDVEGESDIALGISRINAIQEAIRNQSRNDQEPISFALEELVDECLVILNTEAEIGNHRLPDPGRCRHLSVDALKSDRSTTSFQMPPMRS